MTSEPCRPSGLAPLALYCVVFLPPLVYVAARTSSMAVGTFLACLILVLTRPAALQRSLSRNWPRWVAAGALLALVLIHSLIAATLSEQNLTRSLTSVLVIPLFLCGALALEHSLFTSPGESIDRTCRRLFVLMAVLLVIGIEEWIPSSLFDLNKVIFPFAEPSHFALAFTPILMYCAVRTTKWRRLSILFAGFLLSYLVENLTMAVGCMLVAGICVRVAYWPLAVATLAVATVGLDMSYFTSRLEANGDSANLSALVYQQGWQLIAESMERSSYFGIGFQQLGELPTDVPASERIAQLSGLELNLRDGSFTVAKLASEFGLAGMILIAAAVVVIVAVAWRLRSEAQERARLQSGVLLACCVIVSFSLDLFVRGSGYFSGTSLLCAAAGLHLSRQWQRQSTSPRTLHAGRSHLTRGSPADRELQ